MSYLKKFFSSVVESKREASAISFYAALDGIAKVMPEIAESILQELTDQRNYLKLIASENYSSLAVQQAMGTLLTDKYSEGYPFHRFYAGCDNIDFIESKAVELAKKIFGADHAYVQPHSGADANLVAFWSILMHKIENKRIEQLGKKNVNELTDAEYEEIRKLFSQQKILGMALNSGGHLTHGYRMNVSAKMMRAYGYEVDAKTHRIDYGQLEKRALEVKPLILIAGYSAYPRLVNFAKMKEIADKVGAVLMVDMAHFAGLVAGKALTGEYNPVAYADIVTTTTHKTLRGPRGGLVLCTEEYKEVVDKGCPLVLGGPLPHVMAAKAVAFEEASKPQFQVYAQQVISNAKALAEALVEEKVKVLTGGTDNHLILFDVFESFGLTGRQVEMAFRQAHITVNRNAIYNDKMGPWYTSGIRLGTPALTTLGMKEEQMKEIAKSMVKILIHTKPAQVNGKSSKAKANTDEKILQEVKSSVQELLSAFKLYPELSQI